MRLIAANLGLSCHVNLIWPTAAPNLGRPCMQVCRRYSAGTRVGVDPWSLSTYSQDLTMRTDISVPLPAGLYSRTFPQPAKRVADDIIHNTIACGLMFTMNKRHLYNSNVNLPSEHQRETKKPHLYSEAAAQHSSQNQQLYNEEFLCDDCRAVDWSSLPTLAADGLLDIENFELRMVNETTDELRNSSCRICALLSAIKDPVHDGARCVLTAVSLSSHVRCQGIRFGRESASRCAALCILRHDEIGDDWWNEAQSLVPITTIENLGSRTIAPTSVDYSKFKDLLKTCEEEHKVSCEIMPRSNVLGLMVIDTKTEKVVKAPPGCKYLALSYVWGTESGSSAAHNIQNSPPVIRDAISVTNCMGYSYLWVDRYVSHSGPMYKARPLIEMMSSVSQNPKRSTV